MRGLTLDAYQRAASETALYPSRGTNLSYPSLGLAGESGEVLEKAMVLGEEANAEELALLAKELGDVTWYAAQVAFESGLSLSACGAAVGAGARFASVQELGASRREGENLLARAAQLCVAASQVCERSKKVARDEGGVVTPERRAGIAVALGQVLLELGAVSAELGSELGEVAQANLDKLASRAARGVLSGEGDVR